MEIGGGGKTEEKGLTLGLEEDDGLGIFLFSLPGDSSSLDGSGLTYFSVVGGGDAGERD